MLVKHKGRLFMMCFQDLTELQTFLLKMAELGRLAVKEAKEGKPYAPKCFLNADLSCTPEEIKTFFDETVKLFNTELARLKHNGKQN